MRKTKGKTYFDKLMANEKFRKEFDRKYRDLSDSEEGYKKLETLSAKEKGKEKRATKKIFFSSQSILR